MLSSKNVKFNKILHMFYCLLNVKLYINKDIFFYNPVQLLDCVDGN